MRFQTKLFLAAFAAATLALLVAGVGFVAVMRSATDARIEQTLTAEAKLAGDIMEREPAAGRARPLSIADLDAEANRLGARIGAHVTFIAPDGQVVGDSAEPLASLAAIENQATRPEIVEARATGVGRAERASTTLDIETLYVAVSIRHPVIGAVRVALPLTDIRTQLRALSLSIFAALGLALAGGAGFAAVLARRIGQRVHAVAAVAERYRLGDLTPASLDFGDDEIGAVARVLNESVQEIGRRLDEIARDRSRMEAILSGMIEGVIVVDREGRIESANEAARRMLRLETLALHRHYLEAIRHPAVADVIAVAIEGGTPSPVQLSPPRDNARTLMASATPASAARGAILVLHDITELKHADRVRRDFVANVSHELRTPLTAIRGYVEALSEGDTSPEDTRHFLAIILRHALQMERLVKDLLRLARLDAGQETVDLSAHGTRALIAGVTIDVEASLTARRQRINVAIAEDASTVRADPAKLHDALRNLVSNASTYAPEDSLITIHAAREGDAITIAVSDEGPGIPDEDLARVFERFYRVDKSRGRDPGGTGLGLAIVKHLVEVQGGTVRAENRPEGGARFVVTLPL